MALVHNVWPFVFLYLVAAIGLGSSDTVHNAYLSDAYPTHGRARIFTWHNMNDPVSQTIGILLVGYIAAGHPQLALGPGAGIDRACPWPWSSSSSGSPRRGPTSRATSCEAAGMDIETEQEHAPKVLLGSAVTRLLRIRSLYYELVAVAILGLRRHRHPAVRFAVLPAGLASRAWPNAPTCSRSSACRRSSGCRSSSSSGDRLFRRAPEKPLVVAGICIAVFGGLYSLSLYMPHLWMVVVLQFLAQSAVAPLSICIFQTLAATAPPEMRAICFGLFGVYALVFGGFAGGILLGAISDATNVTTALTFIGPVCAVGGVLLLVGSRFVRGDITLVIEDVLERYAEGKRRKAGVRSRPCRSTTWTSTTGTSRCSSTSTSRSPRGTSWPSSAPTGPARARCCGPWPGWTTPTAGSSASSGPTAPTSSPSRSSTSAPHCWWGGR